MPTIAPYEKPQFFDDNGEPLSGGKLYTYETGTTTPKTTYKYYNGTAHTNPIILDARGEPADDAGLYLDSDIAYRFVLKDSNDVEIWTRDYVTPKIGAEQLYGVAPIQVATVAAMKALTGLADGALIQPANRLTGDGVGMPIFEYDSSTATENGGTIFTQDTGGGSFHARIQHGRVCANWFGAIGDGTTNNTTAHQAAVDSLLGKGGAVFWNPATAAYMTAPVKVFGGLKLDLNGQTIKLLASQSDFSRVFNAVITGDANYYYAGAVDSAPLVIENGIIDANRANQGTYTGYELEHQACIAVGAQSGSTGKLVVQLRNLVLKECAGDGLQLTYNAKVQTENVHYWNCFRGGLVVSGGGHQIVEIGGSSGGDVHNYAWNIEPTATPGTPVHFRSYGKQIGGGVDISLENCPGSTSIVDGLVMTGSTFITYGSPSSSFKFLNSKIRWGNSNAYAVRQPRDILFENCDIAIVEDTAEATSTILGMYTVWDSIAGQTCKYKNCKFTVDSSVESGDTVYAVGQAAVTNGNECDLIFQDCKFTGFDFAVLADGGRVTVDNCECDGDMIRLSGVSGSRDNTITVIGRQKITSTFSLFRQVGSTSPGAFKFINYELDGGAGGAGGGENTLNFAGFTNITKVGRRVIYVTGTPTGGALAGDIAINSAPAAAAVGAWVATTNSNTAATWKAAYTLAA